MGACLQIAAGPFCFLKRRIRLFRSMTASDEAGADSVVVDRLLSLFTSEKSRVRLKFRAGEALIDARSMGFGLQGINFTRAIVWLIVAFVTIVFWFAVFIWIF